MTVKTIVVDNSTDALIRNNIKSYLGSVAVLISGTAHPTAFAGKSGMGGGGKIKNSN